MKTTIRVLKSKIIQDFNAVHDRRELLVYACAWGILLLAMPLVEFYEYLTKEAPFELSDIVDGWVSLVPFAILFIFNDLVLSRLIVKRHAVVQYVVCAILAAIVTTLCIEFLHDDKRRWPMEQYDRWDNMAPMPPQENGMPHMRMEPRPDGPAEWPRRQPGGKLEEQTEAGCGAEDGVGGSMLDHTGERIADHVPRDERFVRRKFFGGPMIGNFAIAMMTIFFGVIVKIYNLAERDKERLRHMSYEKTKAELAQLKYQLSPHFMMNTLNNIHALVDIDSEKAKQTIEQMSHLMRYVLYESNKEMVDLSSEISFLKNYIELMKIRYTSSVEITVNMPEETFGIMLPPLLFINMVENAFKHGISYSTKSFVDIQMSINDKHDTLSFCCTNSLGKGAQDEQHGIGLTNVKKRLDLLCPGKYQISAVELADRYVASLSLQVGQTHK